MLGNIFAADGFAAHVKPNKAIVTLNHGPAGERLSAPARHRLESFFVYFLAKVRAEEDGVCRAGRGTSALPRGLPDAVQGGGDDARQLGEVGQRHGF